MSIYNLLKATLSYLLDLVDFPFRLSYSKLVFIIVIYNRRTYRILNKGLLFAYS